MDKVLTRTQSRSTTDEAFTVGAIGRPSLVFPQEQSIVSSPAPRQQIIEQPVDRIEGPTQFPPEYVVTPICVLGAVGILCLTASKIRNGTLAFQLKVQDWLSISLSIDKRSTSRKPPKTK